MEMESVRFSRNGMATRLFSQKKMQVATINTLTKGWPCSMWYVLLLQVYGEFKFPIISDMIERVPITESDTFIDLGSGMRGGDTRLSHVTSIKEGLSGSRLCMLSKQKRRSGMFSLAIVPLIASLGCMFHAL